MIMSFRYEIVYTACQSHKVGPECNLIFTQDESTSFLKDEPLLKHCFNALFMKQDI